MYTRKRVISLIMCLLLVAGNLGLSGLAAVDFVNAEEAGESTVAGATEEPVASDNLAEVSEDNFDVEVTEEVSEPTDQDSEDADVDENVGSFVVFENNSEEESVETIQETEEEPAEETEEAAEETEESAEETEESAEETEEPAEETEEAAEETEEPTEELVELNSDTETREVTVDDVKITVTAEPETFPKEWKLEATKVSNEVQEEVTAAIDEVRSAEEKVAKAYTFDIKVLDADGNEVQPAEGKNVKVSFELAENSDSNVSANVYHLRNLAEESAEKAEEGSGETKANTEEPTATDEGFVAELLAPVEEGQEKEASDTITVETDGFSYYTVEFTYGDLTYIMEGGTSVAMENILSAVGLTGEITNAETEGDVPFEIYTDEGEWYVCAPQPFTTTHTLKVTVKEIVFDIEFGYKEVETSYSFRVTDTIALSNTITIVKDWEGDNADVRPSSLNMYIHNPGMSTLEDGPDIASAMETLAGSLNNITAFRKGTKAEYEAAAVTMLVSVNGPATYMWYDSGAIYYYSAGVVVMNENANQMFDKCNNITDISGLAYINTSYVTSMFAMFRDCFELTDLSPIENWDTGNVESMRFMFGSSTLPSKRMAVSDIRYLEGWNTQSVTDMSSMFKGASVSDVSWIAGWNVSNVANMNSMFFRAPVTDARALKDWNVVRVGGQYVNHSNGNTDTGSFNTMFAYNKDVNAASSVANNKKTVITNLPIWTNRAGTWAAAGTYNPSDGPASGSAPTTNKVKAADAGSDHLISSSTYTVDPTDSSKWIYTFTVPEGFELGIWSAYEDHPANYTVIYNDVVGKGLHTNPIEGIETGDTVTIVNTRYTQDLTVHLEIAEDAAALETFDYTLYLWTGDTEMEHPYDLTGTLPTGVTKTSDGTYTFSLSAMDAEPVVPEATATIRFQNIMNGVHYKVVEDHKEGWELMASTNTSEVLNTDRTAKFLNRAHTALINSYDLVIEMTTSGNQASRDKYFKVQVTLTDAGNNMTHVVYHDDDDLVIPSNGATLASYVGMSNPTTIVTDALGNATATFYLQNDQYVIIEDLPSGSKYTITEIYEDYIPSVTGVSVNGEDTDQTVGTYSVTDTSTGITDDTTIVFSNTKNGVVPTGIKLKRFDWAPIIIISMLGLAVLGLKRRREANGE